MANMEVQKKACTTFVMTSHDYTAYVDEELALAGVTFIFRGHNTMDDQATIRETADRLSGEGERGWAIGVLRCLLEL